MRVASNVLDMMIGLMFYFLLENAAGLPLMHARGRLNPLLDFSRVVITSCMQTGWMDACCELVVVHVLGGDD